MQTENLMFTIRFPRVFVFKNNTYKISFEQKNIVEMQIEAELYVEKKILCMKRMKGEFLSFPLQNEKHLRKERNTNNKYNYLDNIHNDILGVEK